MLTINLFDSSFAHLTTPDGLYSMVGHPDSRKQSKHIKYVRNQMNWDGITIFTDRYLNPNIIKSVKSKYKIGWHLERIHGVPGSFEQYYNLLDFTMTNDDVLLSRYPNKTKFVPFGGGWIKKENQKIHEKSKLTSIIYSSKTSYTGHKLRHQIAQNISGLDLYGNGSPNPIVFKEEGLSDYMFSIVIENIKVKNYFTEKLIDCFLTGAIPIYWGCPNIGDYFDTEGMIIFDTFEELKTKLNNLTEEVYYNNMRLINKNFGASKNYEIPEDWFYLNIIRNYYDR